MNELLKTGFSEMGLSVSDAQLAQLNDFTARMLETNKVMNLTGITGGNRNQAPARLRFPAHRCGFFQKIRRGCRLWRGISRYAAAYPVPGL